MIKTILNHRSIRKYKPDPVPDAVLDEILAAASRASTTGNMQVYSIVITRDKPKKDKLWEAHFKQDMVKQAPVVLTFCADFNRFSNWCELRNTKPGYDNFLSFFTAAIDALLAAQNACLAAEQNGLGICYLGTTTYMAEKIIEVLELPRLVVPVTTVVVGYPDENPGLTDRLPSKGIIHHEKYKTWTEERINTVYRPKETMELYREIVRENGVDNLAQVFAEKRYTQKDNLFFSGAFLDVLTKQGFMNNKS